MQKKPKVREVRERQVRQRAQEIARHRVESIRYRVMLNVESAVPEPATSQPWEPMWH